MSICAVLELIPINYSRVHLDNVLFNYAIQTEIITGVSWFGAL